MFKYALLLSCLCAANIGAVKSRPTLKDSEVLICLTKDAQTGLSSLLDSNHQSLGKIITIHNKAKALSKLRHPYASYKKWRQTPLSEQFHNMFQSEKKIRPYAPFLQELIKNSGDIEEKYYGVPSRDLRQQLLKDTEAAIDNVDDPRLQEKLQQKIAKLKHDKAVKQKIKLFRWIQQDLNKYADNSPDEEIQSRAFFGSVGNQAAMCRIMPELYCAEEENVDKHIKHRLKVLLSGPLINKKTAQRYAYAADNTPFFRELVTVNTIFTTSTDTLCDRAEDQIQQVPDENLKNELTEKVLNHLDIEMRD